MDEWAWEQLEPWNTVRLELPVGPLFCVMNGPTRGRPWSPSAVRVELRRTAAAAASGVALRRISSATPMPLRWPTKVSRCS